MNDPNVPMYRSDMTHVWLCLSDFVYELGSVFASLMLSM